MTTPSYTIEPSPTGGSVDVLRNRIGWQYDLADVDEALAEIRYREGRGVAVAVVDATGYATEVHT